MTDKFTHLSRIRFASGPIQYWNTLWFLFGVAFLSGLVEPFIGYRAVGFVFLLAVMLVGMIGSVGPVIFAALASALTWNYFFIPPHLTFVIREPDDIILCFAFVVAAIVTGYLTTRIRLHERLMREREERTHVLYEVLRDIANSRDKSEFLSKTRNRIGRLLNADCGVFLADRNGKLKMDFSRAYALSLDASAQDVAAWAFQTQKPAGWSTEIRPEADALYIPLKAPSELVGVFVFKPKENRRLGVEQENLLYSVTRQLAISLERHFFEKRLQESRRLEESERLHQTLLNSISHEMRTPLTAILGSASALEDENAARDPRFVKSVAGHLVEAGDRLNRVIENLLDMSRLNSGMLELKLEWHDVHDLVGVTLKKLEKMLGNHSVQINLSGHLPVLKMDFRLMEHAIANLILNAALYSPPNTRILISGEFTGHNLKIIFDDQGPGIPDDARERIFDKFYRVPGTPTGGTGLGLSIVKSIVEAHKGTVSFAPSPLGGARFTITLPVEGDSPSLPEEK